MIGKTPSRVIEQALAGLNNKQQDSLLAAVEATEINDQSVKDSPKKPIFKYNKKLGTSKYNEFLNESDDEEVFKKKEKRDKDGKEF